MFCPRCGQQQISDAVRYCSRCGFSMAGMKEFVRVGGIESYTGASTDPNAVSPRRRGIKQGGIMFLSAIFIVPLLGILSNIFLFDETIIGLAAFVGFVGGILRMVYAAIFQSGNPTPVEEAGLVASLKQNFGSIKAKPSLPSAKDIPAASEFMPQSRGWKETADLEAAVPPNSTTRIGQG